MAASIRIDDPKLRRFHEFWRDEMIAAALYDGIAEASEGERREIFHALAETERRHAAHWERILARAGFDGLQVPRLPFRERTLLVMARRFGVESVVPIILRAEAADARKYENLPEATPAMAAQEKAHGRVISAIGGRDDGPAEEIVRLEGRHRIGAGGALRASVFGVNDGLISNLALVMGFAGGTDDGSFVLLAGILGLFAGALSMAAGEWISVRSQRELYEREIAVEAAELEAFPEEERNELVLIYRAKGIPREEAKVLADQIMERPDTALDTLAREELGLDPGSLGSPWVAAVSSFLSFAVGALVPVVPYFFVDALPAVVTAAVLAALALLAVGMATAIFTGRSAARSAWRQLAIGAGAGAVTYLLGSAVGPAVV
ncbi:MAG TPA: VIT1/CCC1 transporter family protein [Acidimicrobiia bacterium]|nr:VIT1/CCC1 transporter family protein [Acidimicrobiia bacterium]